MTDFINCTPHDITLNNGAVYKATGNVARVSASFSDFDADGVCVQTFGDITNLPDPKKGVCYIVSAYKAIGRTDCVAPATGHPNCVRKDGFIVSVPGFVK